MPLSHAPTRGRYSRIVGVTIPKAQVWGCDAYVKKFQPDKARTQIGEVLLHTIPKKKLLGTPSTTDPKARSLLLRMDPF